MSSTVPQEDMRASIAREIEVIRAAEAQYEYFRQALEGNPLPSPPEPGNPELQADAQRVLDDILEHPPEFGGVAVGGALSIDLDSVKWTLNKRAQFLTELQVQLSRDPSLLNFMDSLISNHVQAAEQRQQAIFTSTLEEQAQKYEAMLTQQKVESEHSTRQQNRFSVIVTAISCVISLAIGWLISAVSPSLVLHLAPK